LALPGLALALLVPVPVPAWALLGPALALLVLALALPGLALALPALAWVLPASAAQPVLALVLVLAQHPLELAPLAQAQSAAELPAA